jgi:hypothetical protein
MARVIIARHAIAISHDDWCSSFSPSDKLNWNLEPMPTCESTVNWEPSSFAACDAIARP